MSKARTRATLVGLDVGTHKTVCIVGESAPGEPLEILGAGTAPSRGIKRGVVVDIEATTASIQQAVREAEALVSCDIRAVTAAIGGSHIRGWNSHGVHAIREREVQPSDVQQVMEAAKAVAIPADQRLIHALAQEYLIDDQDGIRAPIGMAGVRLEVRSHLVTAAHSAVQNLNKCISRCALNLDEVYFGGLAASSAVLSEDERDLGVLLLDIGAGTCDLAVWVHGALRHSAVLPVAGDAVTNDIAVALRTPTSHAEEIKVRYACALATLARVDESILVPSVADREPRRMARTQLAQVVQPRYEEIFALAREELQRSGFEQLVPSGVVLTGGAARMEGACDLAEEVFDLPVRLGTSGSVRGPDHIVGDPIHAVAVGILAYAHEQGRLSAGGPRPPSLLRRLLGRLNTWYHGEF